MNKAIRIITVSLICLAGTVCAFGADAENVLWYRQPAETWADALPTGFVRGLRARGGFELDIAWKGGKLTRADIRAKHTGACNLRYGQKKLEIKTHAGRTYSFNGSLQQM